MFRNLFRSKPWDEKQIARWEKTREKGKWREVFLTTFTFGTLGLLASSLTDHFLTERGFYWSQLLITLPIWYICGYIAGLVGWNSAEKKYRESLNQNEHSEEENS